MNERIWHKSYPPQVPKHLDYKEITIPEALSRTASEFSDHIAVTMIGKKISFGQLDRAVTRFAHALIDIGIRKNDKVAILLPNIPQVFIASQAVLKVGAVVVMHNPLYTERELEYQLNDSESKLAVCLDLLVPRLLKLKRKTRLETIIACHIRDYLPAIKKLLFPFVKKEMHRSIPANKGILDFMSLLKKYSASPLKTGVGFDDLAALIYTGGTTGVPKGAMLTHRNLSVNVQQLKAWFYDARDGEESILGVFPVFHAAGFTAIMNQSIFRGFNVILIPRPDTREILKQTTKYRPDIFTCVPTLFVRILNDPGFSKTDFSCVKWTLSGAAPLSLDTIREWEKRVGSSIVECYGLSETTLVTHANPLKGKNKVGSVGLPLPDTDCRIVDIETGKKEVAHGELGEIMVRGPQLAQGYYNNPQETSNAFDKGWLFTGDIGFMDEEGYLFIKDRKKEMVISKGFNIYPREIDEVLNQYPKIEEACAVGIPDPESGEIIKAFVVAKASETFSEKEVIAFCREKLSFYKVPKYIEFVKELPTSVIGKVMRKKLLDMEKAKISNERKDENTGP